MYDMKLFLTFLCLFLSHLILSQNKIDSLITLEYDLKHFNGSIIASKNNKIVYQAYKGLANFQFSVPIDKNTRFPIASVTKLFTTLGILILNEQHKIGFNDVVSKYISNIDHEFKDITIKQLLLHTSNLENEPIEAYMSGYTLDDFLRKFLKQKKNSTSTEFNYNNLDYILLSKVIENISGKKFADYIQSVIIKPLNLKNTGFIDENEVIPFLAYGYHNYTFGEGKPDDKLYNDDRYLSNYYGAGAMYSTTEDLLTFLKALRDNKLIPKQSRDSFLISPQKDIYIDWLNGKPTYGFYVDPKTIPPTLYRSGNIDGFNSVVITNNQFSKIVIILCNTDTADIDKIGKAVFRLID